MLSGERAEGRPGVGEGRGRIEEMGCYARREKYLNSEVKHEFYKPAIEGVRVLGRI